MSVDTFDNVRSYCIRLTKQRTRAGFLSLHCFVASLCMFSWRQFHYYGFVFCFWKIKTRQVKKCMFSFGWKKKSLFQVFTDEFGISCATQLNALAHWLIFLFFLHFDGQKVIYFIFLFKPIVPLGHSTR